MLNCSSTDMHEQWRLRVFEMFVQLCVVQSRDENSLDI